MKMEHDDERIFIVTNQINNRIFVFTPSLSIPFCIVNSKRISNSCTLINITKAKWPNKKENKKKIDED